MENVEPLVHDPAIQNALTDKITNAITTQVNVTGYANQAAAALTEKGLPRVGTLLHNFAPQISSAFTNFVHTQVHKVVTSPRFAQLWVQANTRIHAQVVKVLSGQGSTSVSIKNGQVVLNLGTVHHPRQTGPGQPRPVHREQTPGHQPDVHPVLG